MNMLLFAQEDFPWQWTAGIAVAVFLMAFLTAAYMAIRWYQKVPQGTALIRNGYGGTQVSFSGMVVLPILHRIEEMDISVKRVEIYRHGAEGLICQDNIRADIKVCFFVRVNKTHQDVMQVAQLLGCERASREIALVELFDSKFSEALKTVGKQFDFVDLYNSRERFKEEILKIIGTDLNGYVLDDAAIDYLEQTPLNQLNQDNILDAEGIKKITDLTAKQQVLANYIRRDKEKTITKQDVEARETILELQKQQAEAEEKQTREISEIRSRQRAEAEIVAQQERRRSETARIATEEEIQVAEENKQRQIIVALKSKQRTEQVETERVEKDRQLEVTERDRVVSLAQIDKDKAVEVEKKNIQEVIRERVMVERAVVEEEEKIKDTREFAGADRLKRVAVTEAQMEAEQNLVKQVQAAEASKQAATRHADEVVIKADAQRTAAERETDARKMLAEAKTADEAAVGLAEAQVITAKADAVEKHGTAEAVVLQRKAEAEAKGQEAKATALEKEGTAEAKVLELKFSADADGITKKAEAMKLFDGVGREHEEFKLRLNKDKDVELAAINVQKDIAAEQARLVGEAVKSARIDIVGGDQNFFDRLVGSITNGKAIDRMVNNSRVLSDVHTTFFNGNPEYFKQQLQGFVEQFGISSGDVKNLSIAALIGRMIGLADDEGVRKQLEQLLDMARQAGLGDDLAASLNLTSGKKSSKS
ncbi:MAG: flotillin family protein [Pirellulaceae bacterium]